MVVAAISITMTQTFKPFYRHTNAQLYSNTIHWFTGLDGHTVTMGRGGLPPFPSSKLRKYCRYLLNCGSYNSHCRKKVLWHRKFHKTTIT